MLLIRFPPLLANEEALKIALAIPAVAQKISGGCSTLLAGAGLAEEVYAGVASQCPGAATDNSGAIAAINLRTGKVSDPRTRQDISSAESDRAAHIFLAEGERRVSNAKSRIESVCR